MIPAPKIYRFLVFNVLNPWMLAPMVAYLWSLYQNRFQRPLWMPTFIVVQAFNLAQGLAFTAMAYLGMNNQGFRHLVQPVVCAGFLFTLFRMGRDGRHRRLLYGACLAVTLAAAMAGAALDGMHWRNAVFTSVMSLVYLGLTLWEMKGLLASNGHAALTSQPAFWVLAALMVYGSGTLLFNVSSNYFLRTLPPHLLPIPWVVVGTIHAIHEALFAKAFLCPKPVLS